MVVYVGDIHCGQQTSLFVAWSGMESLALLASS